MKNSFVPEILDLLPDGVMVLDGEGRILYANEALSSILKVPLPRIIGARCYELLHRSKTRPPFCMHMRVNIEGHPCMDEFYEAHLGCWLWAYAAPVKDERGNLLGIFHIFRDVTAEKKHLLGNHLFVKIVETLPGFFYLSDHDYRILAANRRFKEWVGEEPIGKRCYEVIYKQKEPCSWCRQEEVFREGKTIQWEAVNPRDGRWYLAINSPFDSPTGERLKISLIFDIHERKLLEEKLRRLFEDNPAGLVVTDLEGRILMANRALKRLLRVSEEVDLRGQEVQQFYRDPRERENLLKALLEKGEISGYEIHLRDRAGGERTFLVSSRVFRQGPRLEIWSSLQDITPLKKMELALAESEARFRTLAENAPLAVILMDEEGRITYFNPAAEKIFGYQEKEVLGKDLHLTLAPPEYHEAYLRSFARVKKTGKSRLVGKRLEFRARRRDGSLFPVEVYFSIIQVGKKRFYLGIVQDISERKLLEEERVQLEKHRALELLAGGVAHDFNNLLTSLLGNLELLSRTVEDPRVLEVLSRCEKVAQRAKNLARDLLTFSRGDIPQPKEVIIKDFLKELVSFLVHGSSVRVHLEIPEGIPPLRMDSSHFAQMIQNLVLNALEAMPQGGDIFIQAEYQDGEVILVIRDTGPGIPREIQSRIFEPGFTTKPAGTGLGLAVVKSVVERYGGEIEVFSLPGEGTTFRIRLPAAERPGEKEPPAPETPVEPRKFSGRVLVMDDEEPIRLLLAEALGYLGVEVETAENGPEALEKYERALSEGRPFDLLLLDLTVPGGKGARWVAERLKDRQPRPRLILSTGYSLEGSEAIEPFDGLLRKPYTLEELTELLRRHLRS